MGIVNAGMLDIYEEIELKLRKLVESVVLNTSPDASEKLLVEAEAFKIGKTKRKKKMIMNGELSL